MSSQQVNMVISQAAFPWNGNVRLLRCPDPMKQNGQLTRYRNNGLASWPACHLVQLDAGPTVESRVPAMRSEDMVRTLDQQTSQIGVASLGDAELRVAFPGLAASWS